jgi:hypothetical protein
MIDLDVRRQLSQNVRRLVTGRMTNDDFDDIYYEVYAASADRAVREISAFCYGLYSSDLLGTYRLRGWHAVDPATRDAAARAVLFLRSGREYEWPDRPDNPGLRLLAGFAMFLGIPAGAALLLICIPLILSGSVDFGGTLALLGLAVLGASVAFTLWWPRLLSREWEAFQNSGDHDVWPFLRCADFDGARQSCHMFRGRRD